MSILGEKKEQEPVITVNLNEKKNEVVAASYTNIDLKRAISVFGEDNIRDMIEKTIGSDKIISFIYDIDDNGELSIRQTLLHDIDKTNVKDLILSVMVWNNVKEVWDSDNYCYMYSHVVSIEDISMNNAIVYDGKKIYFRGCNTPLRPYDLYDLVYAKHREASTDDKVKKWKDKLELDKVRAYHPHLSGFSYYLTMDEVKEISTIYKELGISLIAMGDYSNAVSDAKYQYIIMSVDYQ